MMRFRKFILVLIIAGFFSPAAIPEVRAMDPVTIAILAPVAIKAAEVMMPYVLQGLKNAGNQLLLMGTDVLHIFKLPLGVLQSTLGAPIGMFGDGLTNMFDGLCAPFKLVWHTVMFPFSIFGYGG